MKIANSLDEQVRSALATPVESMPETRYVNGETRYMKIQNLGKVAGVARTLHQMCEFQYIAPTRTKSYPQKIKDKEKSKFAYIPPTSANSTAAISICEKVDVKR